MLPDLEKTKSFAFIEKDGEISLYLGKLEYLEKIEQIEELAKKNTGNIVFVLPYRVIREKGYDAIGDEPILALVSDSSPQKFQKNDLIKLLPDMPVIMDKEIVPSLNDKEHAKLVEKIKKIEIEGGNASQVNISRYFKGSLKNTSLEQIFSIYSHLLKGDGQYMTVLFADRESKNKENHNYIIGATPECHLKIDDNSTMMMPIAGTLRKNEAKNFEKALQQFLTDKKEVNELYQVTDEEMKVMCRICPDGGYVEGPFLKEAGNVIHTYYKLIGKRNKDAIKSLIYTLHAPTVVGSPMESAARIIKEYETVSRSYYAGEIGVYSYNNNLKHGNIDSAILIRSAEIKGNGEFRIQAGSGIVRDSDKLSETKETRAKASVILEIMAGKAKAPEKKLNKIMMEKYKPLLKSRNKNLSNFWIQEHNSPAVEVEKKLTGKKITIINNEDDFSYMLSHILACCGANVKVVCTFDYDVNKDESDIVIIGPGPGDVNDKSNKRMVLLQKIIAQIKNMSKPMLGVCLGHQAISVSEAIEVVRQKSSTQGTQRYEEIFGDYYRLGFYNSFSPIYTSEVEKRKDIYCDVDEEGRIIAMKGDNFISFQFHPESIMSQDGIRLLSASILKLII